MSMETTEKGIKKFSKEEKQKILEEAQSNGIKVTLAKYDLSRQLSNTGAKSLRCMEKRDFRIRFSRTTRY